MLTVHTQQSDMLTVHTQQSDMLTVHRGDLDRLATETMMLKEFLPKLLTPDFLGALGKLTQREKGPEHTLILQCELTRILNQNYHRGTIHLQQKNSFCALFSELQSLAREREESEKKLELLKRQNEALKSDYEQEKQVY